MGNVTSHAAEDLGEHEAVTAAGHAAERGGGRGAEGAAERRAESGAGSGAEHGAESGAERGAESGAGRRGAAAGAEGAAGRAGEDSVAKKFLKGATKVVTALAAGITAIIAFITAFFNALGATGKVIAAIITLVTALVALVVLLISVGTGSSFLSAGSENDPEIGSKSRFKAAGSWLEGKGYDVNRLQAESSTFFFGIFPWRIALLLLLGMIITFFWDDIVDVVPEIGGGSVCTSGLLRDKLACKIQNESLVISNYDGATTDECSNSPLSDCDANKCATGVEACTGTPTRNWHTTTHGTTCDNATFAADPVAAHCPAGCVFSPKKCISCYRLQASLNAEHEEETDWGDQEYLEFAGLLVFGGDQMFTGGTIRKLIKSGVKNMLLSPAKKVATQLLKEIMKKAAEKAALMVGEKIAERVGIEIAATVVLGAAMLTPLAPFAALAMAAVNYGMMESMAADIIDVSGYRTYVPNKEQIDKRNAMDAPYIRHISPDSDEKVPPNQPPSIYQLDTLIYALKDSKIPEAKILYILAQAYIEAKVNWTIEILNMPCDVLSSKGMSGPYNHFIEIQLKGHAAGYSGVADGDLDLPTCNATTEVYPDEYPGGYCTYELDLYSAFDSLINHLPQERDVSIMNYIIDYMKRHAPPADVASFLRNPLLSVTETNLWDDTSTAHLVGKSDEIIRPGFAATDPPRQYLGSDLIKNYGIGTEKLSGVSLTEAGCILLNQILDWESYIFPFTQTIEGIPPGIAPSVAAADLQGSLAYDIPKVAFSDFHRVITYISNDPADETPIKLASVRNPGGISLPLYYPSHASTELSCKYGLQAVKLGGDSDITDTTAGDAVAGGAVEQLIVRGALEYMAHGDGTGSGVLDPWMPRLFGVSYDENLGACKYDPAGGPAKDGEHYCTRMGRGASTISPPLSENMSGHGSPGKTYNSCDDSAVPLGWELTIGTEHYRDFIQWYDS